VHTEHNAVTAADGSKAAVVTVLVNLTFITAFAMLGTAASQQESQDFELALLVRDQMAHRWSDSKCDQTGLASSAHVPD
jgi:hypothetical protein